MIFETQFADNCLVLCIHAGCCSHMVPCSRPQENLKRKREKRKKEIFFCFGMGCESMVSHPAFLPVCFTVFTELTSIFFASVRCFAFLSVFSQKLFHIFDFLCVCVCVLWMEVNKACAHFVLLLVLCPSGRLLLFFVFVFSCLINPAGFCVQDSPSQSYYAVFDGHGGAEAAMFCASQLHVNLIRDPNFKTNPELALKQAYAATDKQFLKKAEEQVIWML